MTMIDTSGLSGYQMREGDGPAAVLAEDGLYKLAAKSATVGESGSGNTTISITFVVQDADVPKGSVLYKTIPVSGQVENGPSKGQLNIITLGDLLTSMGRANLVAQMAKEGRFDLAAIAKDIVLEGKNTAFGFVQQRLDDRTDRMRSEVRFFVRPEKYADAQSTGVNFRRPPQAPRASASSKANGVGGAPHSRNVTDAIASDV